jgi:integrase
MTRYPKKGKGFEWTIIELKAIPDAWIGDTISDGGGLSGEVRHGESGISIRFRYAYRWENKTKWHQCGTYPKIDLTSIRKERNKARDLVSKGIDPTAHKKATAIQINNENAALIEQERIDKESRLTIQDLFSAWIVDGVKRKDGNKELRRVFERDILPKLGQMFIAEVTERQIMDLLRDVVKDGTSRKAQVMLINIKQMFAWADNRKPWRQLLIDGNPAKTINEHLILPHDYEEIRTRVLSDEEIKELDNRFIQIEGNYEKAIRKYGAERPFPRAYQAALWISLGTTCRMGELLMSKWSDVDLEKRYWHIPKENTKRKAKETGRDQNVYLSDFVLAQFQAIKDLKLSEKWIFPNKDDTFHVTTTIVSKLVGDRQIQFKNRVELKNRINSNSLVLSEGKNGNWTPHDLRRTAATLMARDLKIPIHIVDECQNHETRNEINKHYIHGELYVSEKKDAWIKLGKYLDILINQEKVIHLKTA